MNLNRNVANTKTISIGDSRLHSIADTTLALSANFWFFVAVIGQWIFVYYISAFYGSSAIKYDFEKWNEVLPHGYVAGNSMGNTALAAHLLFAAIITFGGPLQLFPQIRNRFPAFHRWSGRVYIVAAFIMGFSGLYLGLSGRHQVGDTSQHIAITINGILIIVFAMLSLRFAVKRDIRRHRRWALSLFLVVNGVWFFRVGIMLWLFIHQAPVGFDPKSFQGPFLTFLAFAQYLLPLTVLYFYLRTENRAGVAGRFAMSAGLFVFTILMGIGIFAATMGMWLPRL